MSNDFICKSLFLSGLGTLAVLLCWVLTLWVVCC